MKIFNYKKFLEEVELNLSTLDKDIDGEKRGNILIKKIKDKEPLTTNNNKSVIVDKMKTKSGWEDPKVAISNIIGDDGTYDSDKAKEYLTNPNRRYIEVFMDEDGNKFTLNKFKKTRDFGSKGAGSLTRNFESVQCIFLAIKQAYPDINLDPNNLEHFYNKYVENSKIGNLIFLPDKITIDKELIKDFLQDKKWVSTFCRIPNRFWKERYVDINQLYAIYHASYVGLDSPYIHILRKYKELSKIDGFSDINISKYNPSDVYLVSILDREYINQEIDKCTSINKLSDVLDKFLIDKNLIGISLKKISDSFKIIKNSEESKILPEFFINSFRLGSDMRGIGSKIYTKSYWKHRNNKDVESGNRIINFDSSNTNLNQNIDGEIEGTSSRHGKISFNQIKRIFNSVQVDFKIQDIQTHSELRLFNIKQLNDIVNYLITISNNMKKYFGDMLVIEPISRGTDIRMSENRLISRIQSMQVVIAFMQLYLKDKDLANMVITKMLRYALSIETDFFRTPMYYRII